MNQTKTLALTHLILALVLAGRAPAQDTTFTYQGRLNHGTNSATGLYEMEFSLYDAATGGNQVGTPMSIAPVSVSNGLFTVALDFGAGVFTGAPRWLEIAVNVYGSEQPVVLLSPRQPITATPYALHAATAAALRSTGNLVSGYFATVGGGTNNKSTESYTTVAGGGNNTSSEQGATVGGGRFNYSEGTYCTIAGGIDNAASDHAATIGGGDENVCRGRFATVAGGRSNLSLANSATVGGGNGNQSGGPGATVAGGYDNQSGGLVAVVGGGERNDALGDFATIPGGFENVAGGHYSFAAGRRAQANHEGSFAWADASDFAFASSNLNEFAVRATGGVRFVSAIDSNGVPSATATLAPGSGTWSSLSDRSAKENFAPANAREILDKVTALPLATWNYKAQETSIRHIGPTAQDFHAAFAVGENERTISTVDADGVALAAIQGLNQKLEDELKTKDAHIKSLEQRLQNLENVLHNLRGQPKNAK